MAPRALFAAALALVATGANALSYDAKVTQYTVQTAEVGSCRLKGISTSSDNFKYYASVSSKDVLMQEGCARCIKVTKEGVPSLNAYVIDVCQGCKSGELKLSSAGLSALSIDPNLNDATATYKFINCPSSLLSGSVSACLMEGASNSYIPLQFYNSNKVIASASISGINATQSKDSYFFYATPNTGNSDKTKWFQNVQVSLTSKDGETQSGTFQFSGTSGCTTSTFQFSRSTAAGEDDDDGDAAANGGTSSGGSKSGFLIPLITGVIAALLVIVAAVFFVRRRRASKYDDDRFDHENQFNSPVAKGPAFPPVSPGRPTYAVDNSMHNSTDDPSDGEPNSPAGAFDDAVTPTTVEAANRRVFETINQQRQQQQIEQQQQQQAMAAAPKVAYNTYVAPQTYSYSKPVDEDRAPKNTSFRGSTRAVPTFPAPKLPASHSQDGDSGDEGRSSFDVDDMRETEEIKERERMSSMGGDVRQYAAYSTDAYAAPSVTSPQSYVRATTLRRASTKAPTERPTLRFTTSAPPVPAEEERRSDSFQFGDRQDSYSSDLARDTNKTSSGYSRESLGILGYPYAKKNSSRGSLTEAQL